MAIRTAVLLAVGDKVALDRAVVVQTGPVQDAQVLRVQEIRKGRFATMIVGMAEVIAKRGDAGRIVKMTGVIRRVETGDGKMAAVPVREITVEEMAEVAEWDLEADEVSAGEALVVQHARSGRNGRPKIAGRHGKNEKRVSHETKRNAGPLRCARVEAALRV